MKLRSQLPYRKRLRLNSLLSQTHSAPRILALCVMVQFCACGLLKSPVRREAEKFLTLMQQGKHADALRELSPTSQRLLLSEYGALKDANLDDAYRSQTMVSYSITKIDASDDSAVVHVKITTKDGVVHLKDVDLIKEDGAWRIRVF